MKKFETYSIQVLKKLSFNFEKTFWEILTFWKMKIHRPTGTLLLPPLPGTSGVAVDRWFQPLMEMWVGECSETNLLVNLTLTSMTLMVSKCQKWGIFNIFTLILTHGCRFTLLLARYSYTLVISIGVVTLVYSSVFSGRLLPGASTQRWKNGKSIVGVIGLWHSRSSCMHFLHENNVSREFVTREHM